MRFIDGNEGAEMPSGSIPRITSGTLLVVSTPPIALPDIGNPWSRAVLMTDTNRRKRAARIRKGRR